MTPSSHPDTPPGHRLTELQERRAQLRGLLYLALAAILFVLLRFGWSRIATPGWWRLW